MKTKLLQTLLFSSALLMPFVAGCAQEVSHTESDKPGWFGGRTKTETTVIRNSDGTVSTEHSSQTTK